MTVFDEYNVDLSSSTNQKEVTRSLSATLSNMFLGTDIHAFPQRSNHQRKIIFWMVAASAVIVAAVVARNNLSPSHDSPQPWNGPPVLQDQTVPSHRKLAAFFPGKPGEGDNLDDLLPDDDDAFDDDDAEAAWPVIKYQGDDRDPEKVPSHVAIHAAEALICRESVINFVINATDGKDECQGLTKAFDKTCYPYADGGGGPGRRRRKLWEKTQRSFRWQVWWVEGKNALNRYARYILGDSRLLFFAEDEIVESWDEAKYLVDNNLVSPVLDESRLQMERQHRLLQAMDDDDEEEEVVFNKTTTTTATTTTGAKPNLSIPSASQHMSDEALTETVMLHQGESIVEQVANQSKALLEAKASSKAMSDTTEAVTALLNDPTSVEARTCCASILSVFHENCKQDDEETLSDSRLFFVVLVIALCGIVKSLIRHYQILWLPEAAGCILVGVLSGYAMAYFPHPDLSFDGNWFLRIMVPPIIFEAALSIDKRSFNRHIVPILIYAIAGTLLATLLTAIVVHRGTAMLKGLCPTIPYVEALTFGALISSIDPIAVLSVLSNMGMNDTDTIYVLIFGESLLNDGVSIVLFHTLVNFLDETLVIDGEAVAAAAWHFFIVAVGSLVIGVASGMLSTVYYWLFHGCQTPLVEVLMFFCWALLPYYVSDGIGWSGIVSAVAVGFVMDLHIVGQRDDTDGGSVDSNNGKSPSKHSHANGHVDRGRREIFSREGHLSDEAKHHIGFVMEIISTMMETAIFAYLGLFLFSHRYHWNIWHAGIAILACAISRAMMIASLSLVANWVTRIQQSRVLCKPARRSSATSVPSNPAGVIVDKKMQLALWFAGLRGAMSFALVEHIPLYDEVSGVGSRLKPELKAMTSASIMFTVFVLGGYTYYMMQHLGIAPNQRGKTPTSLETASLLQIEEDAEHEHAEHEDLTLGSEDPSPPQAPAAATFDRKNTAVRRQRTVNS